MRYIILLILIQACIKSSEQNISKLTDTNNKLIDFIQSIKKNDTISCDSASYLLKTWNTYPKQLNLNQYLLYEYYDPIFGIVPVQVYIPSNYSNTIPSPLVLLLHGATVLSSFKDAYKDTIADETLFLKFFEKHNFIIVRPFADSKGPNTDGTKLFDWVINHHNGRTYKNRTNPTFNTLVNIISKLKSILNIDDEKIFAFGHSDGADGAFALQVYKPSLFAGFIVYNSMLTNLMTHDIYLRNTINRPLYLVHSDLDNLRPIQQTRLQVKLLDSIRSPVLYKEYYGYKHFDKHLAMDLPYSYEWMKTISRNPFQNNLQWEVSDTSNSGCDWLKVIKIDTSQKLKLWHYELNPKWYNKKDSIIMDIPYYNLNKSGLVKASYNNNQFEIQTSCVTEIEILISPVMVNLQNPITIIINGKKVYNQKVIADKNFLLEGFKQSFDRIALWTNSIKLRINQVY